MDQKKPDTTKPSDGKSFEEKQKILIEKWNAVFGKKEEDKKEETPKPSKKVEPKPVVHWCEGGILQACPNKASIHINCDTNELWYQLYLCTECYKSHHLNGKEEKDLPDGLRIFRIEGDTEVLAAGRPRSLDSSKGAKIIKEKKKPASAATSLPAVTMITDKKTQVAFIFNGQGAQEVGMTKDVQHLPAVKQLFETAKSILGYDLRELVLSGPKEKLDSTEFSQPAMLVAGLAALEKLRSEDQKAVDSVNAFAGLSLGEYTALVAAGALTVEDALRVVKVRGEAMTQAATSQKGGMVSVVGLSDAQLNEICEKARDIDKKQKLICQIANYNFPQGRVVSGHEVCMDKVIELAKAAGATKATKLFVSGAFHSELMSSASKALETVLADVAIKAPRVPVYANVTGEPYTTAEDVRKGLVEQLVSSVKWEQCVDHLIRDGVTHFYELAPRNQLSAMLRRQNPTIHKNTKNITV